MLTDKKFSSAQPYLSSLTECLCVDWVVGVGVCVTASPHWYLIKTFFFLRGSIKTPPISLSLSIPQPHSLYCSSLLALSISSLCNLLSKSTVSISLSQVILSLTHGAVPLLSTHETQCSKSPIRCLSQSNSLAQYDHLLFVLYDLCNWPVISSRLCM